MKCELVEIALEGDWDGFWAADRASSKRFLEFDSHYLVFLVLDEVALHFLLGVSQVFDHLDDFNSTNDGVGAGDSWDDVACHVLDFVERLLLNAEAMHSEIGGAADEMDDIIVVFLEDY